MNLDDFLKNSQVVCDYLLSFLDAKSLANFGSCNKLCRILANSKSKWHALCKSEGYLKYQYLNDLSNHPLIPAKSSAASLIYFQYETNSLVTLNKWRELYNRSEHMKFNWLRALYFIPPLLTGHSSRINSFDSNGLIIVSVSEDEKIINIWSIQECACINTFKLKNDYSASVIKIYKENLIVGGENGIIRIIRQSDGDLLKSLISNNESCISDIIIEKDNLIAVFGDNVIRVWSLVTYKMQYILQGHEDDIESVFLYEKFIITGSWDNTVIIWNLHNGSNLLKLEGHTEVINDLKMKNNEIVSASSDTTLRIWSIQTDKLLKSVVLIEEPIILNGHLSDVYCVEINNEFICSGSADSSIIVWNFQGELLHKLFGHLGIVRCLAMDDYKLVSGGDAKKIMIWDYKKGELLNEIHRNPNKLSSLIVNDTNIISVSPEPRNNSFDITVITFW